MSPATQNLFDQAMQLPSADLQELVNRLTENVLPEMPGEEVTGEEWEAAWGEEIRRRLDDIENGTAELISLEDFMAQWRLQTKEFAVQAEVG